MLSFALRALCPTVARLVVLATTFTPLLYAAEREAARWPQFRGPDGQGVAATTKPPTEWSESKNIAWKTDIPGLGFSSPVIWDDQIWLTTALNDGKELRAIGLDRHTGQILHNVLVLSPTEVDKIHDKNSHASPTPVIAEGRLYMHFGTHGAAALDTATGAVLWRNTNLKIKHDGGPGSSPRLFDKLLLVTSDGADHQYVAGLDVDTGEIKWKRERSAPYRENPITRRAFATPLLIEHAGRSQLISPAADQLHSYDPATGAELWHVRYTGFSTVPCPVYADGMIFMCTGYFNPELAAIKVDGKGDVTKSHVKWRYRVGVPDTPSPLYFNNRLYIVSDKGIASSLDAKKGTRVWTQRLGGNYSASPLLAGEHLYFSGEDGITRVLKVGDSPKIVAENKLPGRIMASPVPLGTALFVRTDASLYRIEEKSPAK